MPLTKKEIKRIEDHGYFCVMGPAMFVAYLNVYLDRAPGNRLMIEDNDVRWLLGHRDAREPNPLQ